MAIENTLLLKIGGGLTAAGGVTAVGVAYKDNIYKWFSPTNETITYFFVTSQTGVKDTITNELYKDVGGKKVKNYKCKLESKTYECDIVKKIDKTAAATKKWLNLDTNFSAEKNDEALTKSSFETANELFLLKINTADEITFDDTKLFDVIDNDDNTKKFGQLKPIFSKKNNEIQGKIKLFLVKIKSFKDDSTSTFSTETGKTYSCSFVNSDKDINSSSLKPCEIYKFDKNTTQSSVSEAGNYDSVTFVGKEEKVQDNSTLKKHEYYLVKFTNDILFNDYSGKQLIYLEEDSSNPKKVINFSNIGASFLFNPSNSADDGKLLIIDKK